MAASIAVVAACVAFAPVTTASPAGGPAQASKKCKKKKKGAKRKKCKKPVAVQPPSTPPKVTLTVIRNPTGGGTIDSIPTGISCGTVCSAQFDAGTAVTLDPTDAPGFFQTGWSGAGCSGRGNCNLVLNSDTTVTATFVERVTVTATIDQCCGTVDVSSTAPFAICTDDPAESCTVNKGDDVTVTATPQSGFSFLPGWGGDCLASGMNLTHEFTDISPPDKACSASFNS